MDENEDPLTDDPEILALLAFEPVVRKCKRHDGWTPANQRIYILGLAETGNVDAAAQRIGRTMSGAYKVRTSAGAGGFAEAWDKALALHHRRNPRPLPKGRPSRGEILAGSGRSWPARAAPPESEAALDPAEERKARLDWANEIIRRYWLKLGASARRGSPDASPRPIITHASSPISRSSSTLAAVRWSCSTSSRAAGTRCATSSPRR